MSKNRFIKDDADLAERLALRLVDCDGEGGAYGELATTEVDQPIRAMEDEVYSGEEHIVHVVNCANTAAAEDEVVGESLHHQACAIALACRDVNVA